MQIAAARSTLAPQGHSIFHSHQLSFYLTTCLSTFLDFDVRVHLLFASPDNASLHEPLKRWPRGRPTSKPPRERKSKGSSKADDEQPARTPTRQTDSNPTFPMRIPYGKSTNFTMPKRSQTYASLPAIQCPRVSYKWHICCRTPKPRSTMLYVWPRLRRY